MTGIVDYGMGNLHSVEKAVTALGETVRILRAPSDLEEADRIILPGVGAFGDAMMRMQARGWDTALTGAARSGRPLLGICLGMQLLLDESEEFGLHGGLGLISGCIIPFGGPEMRRLRIPQIGWNDISPEHDSFLAGLKDPYMYFVHSYHASGVPREDTAAWCTYGETFVCAVQHENIWGTQFHPEKSGSAGLEILRRFLSA